MATKRQVGWNKRSGSTDPPDVLLCGGSATLDPPYGTAWDMTPRSSFRAQRSGNPEPGTQRLVGGMRGLSFILAIHIREMFGNISFYKFIKYA